MDQRSSRKVGGDAPKSEIRIVSRKRSSSVDGALIVDWSSTVRGRRSQGYVEMGEMAITQQYFSTNSYPITMRWRTTFGHEIMWMHWEISLVSASLHSNYWKEWTV